MKKELKIALIAAISVLTVLLIAGISVAFYQKNLNKKRAEERANSKYLEKLVIGYESESGGFYPNIPFEVISYEYNNHFYEGLTTFDNEFHIKPLLAESWENPDDKTWRFRLKDGVKFHDGTVLTSEDVKASVDLSLANENTAGTVPGLVEAKIVDERTIDLITEEASPLLVNYLTALYILPKNLISENKFENPIGTGPYKYVSNDNGILTLSRNEDYYGDKPSAKTVVLKSFVNTEERVNALKNGEVDVIQTIEDSQNPGTDKAGKDLLATSIPGVGTSFLTLDVTSETSPYITGTTKNPFKDIRVRRAMQKALNSRALLSETQTKDAVPASQTVSPIVFGYNNEIKVSEQDIVEAKKLMQDAGYGSGFGVTLDINEDGAKLGEGIKNQLSEIGIAVTVNPVSDHSATLKRVMNGDTAMTYLEYLCTTGDALEAYEALYGSQPFAKNSYQDASMQSIIEKTKSTLDQSKRKEYLGELATMANDAMANIPLFVYKNTYGYRQGLVVTPRYDAFLTASNVVGSVPENISKNLNYFETIKYIFIGRS